MNQMASILGYSELIHHAENLTEETRVFASEILNSAKRAQKIVAPDDLDIDGSNLWAEALASKYDLQIVGSQQVPSNLQTPGLLSAIDQIFEFLASEGCPGSNRRLEVNRDLEVECSACALKNSDDYLVVGIMSPDLKFDPSHFKNILSSGFSTTHFGSENPLQVASRMMHEQYGHLQVSMNTGDFAVKLLVPLHESIRQVDRSDESAKARILIVDDEIPVAEFLGEVVRRAGFSTTIFNDPLIALDSFKLDPFMFDLVITDQSMPGLTGEDLMTAVKALRPELPVLVCTGHSSVEPDKDDVLASLSDKAVLISKPLDVPRLLQTISDSLK
jgi:CheY-like chemotaxis protein